MRGKGTRKGPKTACEAGLRAFWGCLKGLTGGSTGSEGVRMRLNKGLRRAPLCTYSTDKQGGMEAERDTQKGRKRPLKARMFKTAANPFKKSHVFQTGAKLVPNWCQNRVASLVKHPLQKVKNDLARVKSVLNRGAKTWCSAL